MKKYRVLINENWCKGCYICQGLCPKNVFEPANTINDKGIVIITAARQEDCIGCHQCDTHCPDLAIIVEKEGD